MKTKYKGMELTEFESDKNVAFNPPKKMFVWDCEGYIYKRRVVAYLGGYHRDYKVRAFGPIDECKALESYAHCAEIPPVRTNWDTFQQRYGTEKIDVKDAITKFIYSHMRCDFCPAKQQCRNLHTGDLKACVDTFKAWAEMEADQ